MIFQFIYTASYQYPTVSNTDYFHTCTFFHVPYPPSRNVYCCSFLFSLFLPHQQTSSRFYDVWKILDYNSTLELRNHVSFPSLSLFVYECLQASRCNTSKMASLLPLLVLKLFPIPSVFTTIKLPW